MKWFRSAAPLLALVLCLSPVFARKKKISLSPSKQAGIAQMSRDQEVLHALNRLAFGPRPGDVERVRKMGLDEWIESQLHPESVPENPGLAARLAPLETLSMSVDEMARKYPSNLLMKQMITGRLPWPTDPETRVIVQRIAARYGDKFGGPAVAAQPTLKEVLERLTSAEREGMEAGGPLEQAAVFASLSLSQQFDLIATMPVRQRQVLFAFSSPVLQRRILSFGGAQKVVAQDLQDAKILRAVYSNRQLEEVLTDFWYNHFNVNLEKGADRYLATSYERDAIRPHVMGKFHDLLLATAESPAMLFYLDNFQSVRAGAEGDGFRGGRAKRGLNENYGRELLELHTLGVDGGYTQKDVTEVARCFTGWTIRGARRGGGFEFHEREHDPGEKIVLGVRIPAGGGIKDGYQVIDILSHHPSTARFISRSLAIRFVSDDPPKELVERMAETFQKSDGDLREVMRTMLGSQEFWAASAYRAKIKSPFEMVVSALRATDADIRFGNGLEKQLTTLGEPLYRKVEPTGYSNRSSEWMNSAALLGRINFALDLAANKLPGVRATLPATEDAGAMARDLVGADLSVDSQRIVEKGLAADAKQTPGLLAGLTLSSPDFQRR